jgi:VWFA-related protein
MKFRAPASAAAFLLVAIAAGAQNQPAPQPNAAGGRVFRTEARSVVLDVVVTDANGAPVTGLKQSDFFLKEDGKAQTINFFRAPAPAGPGETSSGRSVILLDALNSKFEDFGFAVGSVRKFLGGQPQLPEPTAVMLLTRHGTQIIGGFTTDGAQLLAAMKKRDRDLVIDLQGGGMPLGDVLNLTLGAMAQLGRSNMDSGHHLSVLWVSPGIQSQYLEASQYTNLADFVAALHKLSGELLVARTTLNAVDPQGVGEGRITPTTVFTDQGGSLDLAVLANNVQGGTANLALGTLTSQTGGAFLFNRNNVNEEIKRVLTEAASSYAVAYSPSNPNFNGKFRRVQLQVGNGAYTVRTRPGYFAQENPRPSNEDATYEISHAARSDVAYTGLTVEVAAAPVAADKLPLQVQVRMKDLQWQAADDGAMHARIALLAVAFDSKGKALVAVRRTMSAKLPVAGFNAGSDKNWTIPVAVPYDKADVTARVVVNDPESGRIGSAQVAVR